MNYSQAEAKLRKYEFLINKTYADKRLNNSVIRIETLEIKEFRNGFDVRCVTNINILDCSIEYVLKNFEEIK